MRRERKSSAKRTVIEGIAAAMMIVAVGASIYACSFMVARPARVNAEEFYESFQNASAEVRDRCVAASLSRGTWRLLDAEGSGRQLLPLVYETPVNVNPDPATLGGRTVLYDFRQAETCLEELEDRACDPAWLVSPELEPWIPDSCATVLRGTVAVGEDCRTDIECSSGICSATDVVMGGMCPGRCVAPGAVGASCATASDCESNLICSGNVCATPPAPPCPVSAAGVLCGDHPGGAGVCDPVTGTCLDAFPAGGVCRDTIPAGCPADQVCVIPSGMTEGTCTRLPTRDEDCQSNGRRCAPGLACISERGMFRCSPRREVGVACSPGQNQQCASGLCQDGVCAAAPLLCRP